MKKSTVNKLWQKDYNIVVDALGNLNKCTFCVKKFYKVLYISILNDNTDFSIIIGFYGSGRPYIECELITDNSDINVYHILSWYETVNISKLFLDNIIILIEDHIGESIDELSYGIFEKAYNDIFGNE